MPFSDRVAPCTRNIDGSGKMESTCAESGVNCQKFRENTVKVL